MLTGRKYRLAFTPEQAEFAETIVGICRSMWNTALEQCREYRRWGAWTSYHGQAEQLVEAKTGICGCNRPVARAAAGAEGSGSGVP